MILFVLLLHFLANRRTEKLKIKNQIPNKQRGKISSTKNWKLTSRSSNFTTVAFPQSSLELQETGNWSSEKPYLISPPATMSREFFFSKRDRDVVAFSNHKQRSPRSDRDADGRNLSGEPEILLLLDMQPALFVAVITATRLQSTIDVSTSNSNSAFMASPKPFLEREKQK